MRIVKYGGRYLLQRPAESQGWLDRLIFGVYHEYLSMIWDKFVRWTNDPRLAQSFETTENAEETLKELQEVESLTIEVVKEL